MQQTNTHTKTQRSTALRRAAVALTTAALVGAPLTAVSTPAVAKPSASKAAKRADLQVAKLGRTPAAVKYGATFDLGATISNRGRSAAKPTKLRIYLSKNRSADKGDTIGATVNVTRIPARKAKTVSGTVRVPADARGTYWVIACADATTKVKEAKERNNCRVSTTRLTIDASIKAELSGTLTFTDQGQTDDGAGRTETWRRTATVNVKVAVTGDPATKTGFADSGSTYTRAGNRTQVNRNSDCLTEVKRDESSQGWMSDYQAEITGHFTRTDMSGVRVGLHVPAVWTNTETRTPQRENGCDLYGLTTTGKDIVVQSVELKEVSTAGGVITYDVVGWTADMNIPSEYESLTGQLTLRLS